MGRHERTSPLGLVEANRLDIGPVDGRGIVGRGCGRWRGLGFGVELVDDLLMTGAEVVEAFLVGQENPGGRADVRSSGCVAVESSVLPACRITGLGTHSLNLLTWGGCAAEPDAGLDDELFAG